MKDGCTKCENKVEDADKYVCCGDCTYPEIVYDTSLGYCKSGAQLILQPKPKGISYSLRFFLIYHNTSTSSIVISLIAMLNGRILAS